MLGPLFYVYYIMDLFDIQTTGHILSCLDDTYYYYLSIQVRKVKEKSEKDLTRLRLRTTYHQFYQNKIYLLHMSQSNFITVEIKNVNSIHHTENVGYITYKGCTFKMGNTCLEKLTNKSRNVLHRFKII